MLTADHIMRTISNWTGIPVEKVDVEDKKRLALAEEYLKKIEDHIRHFCGFYMKKGKNE